MPALAEASWRHKYFSLLYPNVIEAFPSVDYQEHQVRKALERLLGPTIVQRSKQRIDAGLFEGERHHDVVQALLSSFDSITATRQAVEAEAQEAEGPDDEEGDEAGTA